MNQYRYQLEPYKTPRSRYTCPECMERKRFTRYLDTETNTHLAHYVGKCDREESCGYHYTPKQYFEATGLSQPIAKPVKVPKPAFIKPNTIPQGLFEKSLNHYKKNNLVRFLHTLFDFTVVNKLINDYLIGTSKYWEGGTIFWQIDRKEKVRTGKIMLYHADTGKRVKTPYNHITWAHVLLQNAKLDKPTPPHNPDPDLTPNAAPATKCYILKQCLFGEHLLDEYPDKVVAIVESEKTAIIAAGFMPEYLWLAAGSLEGLNHEKCKVLKNREVMLYPDMDGFLKWQDKMLDLKQKLPETRFGLSDYMLKNVPQEWRTPGMDIADYLLLDQQYQFEFERELGLRE